MAGKGFMRSRVKSGFPTKGLKYYFHYHIINLHENARRMMHGIRTRSCRLNPLVHEALPGQ